MKTSLDYRKDYLCVLSEREVRHGPHIGLLRQWYPVHKADQSEVRMLLGLPVTQIDSVAGIYADEEGNVFRLAEGGGTKAIEVEKSNGKLEETANTGEASHSDGIPSLKEAASQNYCSRARRNRGPRFKGRREWFAAAQAAVRK